MTDPDVISAHNVTKTFGSHKAVNEASFTVRRGRCFGLLGANGAGKSTLISMIYGLTKPSAGQLRVFGLDPARDARAIKRRLGVVTQVNALDEALTVRENMEIYAAFLGLDKKTTATRVPELLEFMNLTPKANSGIATLSGGMQRRLVFVRALLHDPELVILDEPTTGLDPAVRHLLWGKVNQLKERGKTILLTTHYLHEAEMLCDHLVIMSAGRVLREGSPAEIRERVAPGFVGMFDARADHADLISAAKEAGFTVFADASGVFVRAPDMSDVMGLAKKFSTAPTLLRPANLEDAFLKLTGSELNPDA